MKRQANRRSLRVPLTITMMTIAGLTACGGGSGDPAPSLGGAPAPAPAPAPVAAPAPAPAPAPTTTPVAVKVIDGALRNALVCLDVNDDGACGTGEPQARTDANGAATLDVPNALVGRHAVVAVVGTDAVDADFGPVTAPFVLVAPRDRASVVSPLTTLVDAQMRATGADSATTEALLRQRAGLQASLFADYTAAPSSDAAASDARTVARLVVLTTQQQTAALASVVGTPDLSATPISQADVRRATNTALLGVLPTLGAVLTDPAVTGAANRDTALQAFAQNVVANETGLTAASAASAIGLQRLYAQAPSVAEESGAGASLRALRFTSATDWFYRALVASAADNVPNAQGLLRYYDLRRATVSGTVQTWGYGGTYARRGDLFWNGSAWTDCPYGTRGTSTPRDAAGRSSYVYCGGYSSGTSQRTETPIDGRTMESVTQQIRGLPGSDSGVAFSSWGPASLASLGGATFPAGSKLGFQRNVETATAITYDPTAAALSVINADVAAGGDATAAGPATDPPCRAISGSTPLSSYSTVATGLEQVIARNRGTPCRYAPGTDSSGNSSGSRNEWWGNSTLSIGTTVPPTDIRPPGTGTYYTQTRDVRFAFTGTGQVTFYNCVVRTGGGSGRNCDVAGTGTYRIDTLGDARVLTLSTPPASTAPLTYERVLIERGGVVWSGFKVKPGTFDSVRLNLVAANAILGQLGLPTITP